jgi:hypothetical protein
MISRDRSTNISRTRSNNPVQAARRGLAHGSSLEGVVRRLHHIAPSFNQRRLSWDEAVTLAAQLGAPVVLQRSRLDAYLARPYAGARIVVDRGLNQADWGVFCVVHEIAHLLVHPGPREFYLGSPGWCAHAETQANTLALLALSPQPSGPPYPRVLQAEAGGAWIQLLITYVSERGSAGDLGPRWLSKKVTLQRLE